MSVNQEHFKAGGGNAAVKKLLAAQAGAASRLTGGTPADAKPTEAQLARLRAKVAAAGKRELERQQESKNREERANTTYSGNKVFRNGKHVGDMVNGKYVPKTSSATSSSSSGPRKVKYPVEIGKAEESSSSWFLRFSGSSVFGSSGSSSGSSSSSSSSGGGQRNYSSQAASADVRPAGKKPSKGLRSDFSDIGGRLAAALGGAQDEILKERKIKRGMNYGSEDTNDYKVKAPDFSAKAAAAKRLRKKKEEK